MKTNQVVHFNDNWKASYYNCSICNNDEIVPQKKEHSWDKTKITNQASSDMLIFLRSSYWGALVIFIAIFSIVGLNFGWLIGLIISVIVTLLAMYIWLSLAKASGNSI